MNNHAYRFHESRSIAAELAYSTCWYCDHHVPNGQRFCNKDCAEAFEDDEVAAEKHMMHREGESAPALV